MANNHRQTSRSPSNNARFRGGRLPHKRHEGGSVGNDAPRRSASFPPPPATAPVAAANKTLAVREKRNGTLPHRPTSTPPQPSTPPSQDAVKPASPRAEWRDWPEVNLKVDNLPPDVTTQVLWSNFSREGKIFRIEILDGPSGKFAKLCFQPPPKRSFWHQPFSLVHPDESKYPNGCNVVVTLSRDLHARRGSRLKVSIKLKQLEFGSMVGPTTMVVHKAISPPGMELELDVNRKQITARFFIPAKEGGWNGEREFCFRIALSQVSKLYQSVMADGTTSWVLSLHRPPPYYWKMEDVRAIFSPKENVWTEHKVWYRATNIVSYLDETMKYPVAVHTDIKDSEYIDIGSWTTFRFVLPDNALRPERNTWTRFLSELREFNVAVIFTKDFCFQPVDKTMWHYLDHPSVAGGQASALLKMAATPVIHLEPSVRYQLEACVSRGILNEDTVTAEFLQMLAGFKPTDAVRRLEFLADQKEQIFNPVEAILDTDAASFIPNSKLPHYCILMRKAVVTPTSIRFSSPTVETSNRVLRKYNHMQDRFLRVQFLEEEEQKKICFSDKENDEIWKRMLRTLYQGIRIGDRLYEFLGFGNSQLRECGAYFFCPTEHLSCDDIRKWMGDFDHIRIVAKYAARIGQCFSTTREIRGICKPSTKRIPDIERNGYCFTDGVGIISEFLAGIVNVDMDVDVLENPTAFQFRMGGSKGVLAVWPKLAKGMEVMVRESQEKFRAEFNGLEIVKCARRSTATLNRQTIPILECLGVPVKAFVDLLDRQIREYQRAMKDDAVAVTLLTKYVDEAQNTLTLAEMLQAGFNRLGARELFVVNLLNLWRSWTLRLLKEKARIQVEKSAFVLGCVDETGTLRGHSKETEGAKDKDVSALPQIFLQLTDPAQCDKTFVLEGLCIVGRNPSLHPGDIRVVEAVDLPQLRHLKDVIVFPSTGDRPLPNMLSGGDLDGDDFFCIWDPTLMPDEWNYPPMNYSGTKPEELSKPVEVDDIRNFFVKYMKNDVLGLIAHSHVAHADAKGPKSQICQMLAEEHSKAVDYPKTGQPAEYRSWDWDPKKWPHFLEKRPSRSYKSTKSLGVIYDSVLSQTVKFQPDFEHGFDQRILSKFELDDATLQEARRIKGEYDMCVRRVLSQHSLATEFELFTTWAMSAPPVGTDYKRQEQLGHEFQSLKMRFREECYKAAGGSDAKKLDRFVAAMYQVTEEEMKAAQDEPLEEQGEADEEKTTKPQSKSMPLISFPWIFHLVLIRIATGLEPRVGKSRVGLGHWMPGKVAAAAVNGGKTAQDKPSNAAAVDGGKTASVAAKVSDAAAMDGGETPPDRPSDAAAVGDDGAMSSEQLRDAAATDGGKTVSIVTKASDAAEVPVLKKSEFDMLFLDAFDCESKCQPKAATKAKEINDDLVQLLDGNVDEATRRDGEADLFSASDCSDADDQLDRAAALFGFTA
ncbi:suppressor of ascus dominance [Ophiocordyceps camponoti-floridani]|uniref:RNA-dependent RNA polymerase n=1 Tax=Ophiocordyceps camponoti-floridani TaxID=2030778 RepID=A0A8H4Q884_9HYPO|nr:suppressor of ascus dominance [Ophiocordyceps camponoti-floridani]